MTQQDPTSSPANPGPSRRLLHLIREGGSIASPAGLALLSAQLGCDARTKEMVLCAGGQWFDQACEQVGLDHAKRITPGRGFSGLWRLRRAVCELGPLDLIHCDHVGVLFAANRACKSVRKVITLGRVPTRFAHRAYLKRCIRKDNLRVITSCDFVRSALLAWGASAEQVRYIPPAVDPAVLVSDADAITQLRQRWNALEADPLSQDPANVQDAAGRPVVIGILSDRPWEVDIRKPSLAAGLADMVLAQKVGQGEVHSTLRVLIDPDAAHRARAMQLTNEFGHKNLLIQEESCRRPWQIAAACDILFVVGKESVVSLHYALLAGKPMVVQAHRQLVEHLPANNPGIIFAKPGDKRTAADTITLWVRDPRMRKQAADAVGQYAQSGNPLAAMQRAFGELISS